MFSEGKMKNSLSWQLLFSIMLIIVHAQISDAGYIKVDLNKVNVVKLEDAWMIGF